MVGWKVWTGAGTGVGGVCTSLTCGLKLSRVAVLPIASYGAGADLDHVAGVRPQPVQLHGVLLAGHCGGDALTLQYQEEGCVSVGPDAHRPLPTPDSVPKALLSRAPDTLWGNLLVPRLPPAPGGSDLLKVLHLVVQDDSVGPLWRRPGQGQAASGAAVQV